MKSLTIVNTYFYKIHAIFSRKKPKFTIKKNPFCFVFNVFKNFIWFSKMANLFTDSSLILKNLLFVNGTLTSSRYNIQYILLDVGEYWKPDRSSFNRIYSRIRDYQVKCKRAFECWRYCRFSRLISVLFK